MLSRALNIYMYIASPVSKGMEDSSSKPVKVDKGSIFGHLNPSQHEAGDIFNMMATFNTDRSPNKVNLGIGVYCTEEGQPFVLPVVRKIEAQMSADLALNHDYIDRGGLGAFTDAASKLLLGDSSLAITQNRVCGVQTVSGAGAVRLGMAFLFKYHSSKVVYVSKPTWATHIPIVRAVGYTDLREYRYYKKETRGLDHEGMLKDIKNAPEGSIFIFHACAHNPTGVDPTKEQWKDILTVVKEKNIFILFDTAYQGFASGDPDTDAWAIREAVHLGLEFFVAQSFSKNFGLYNERAGQLCCVVNTSEAAIAIRSQLLQFCRALWSTPPNHGAQVVAIALNNPSLKQEWLENLTIMTDRIHQMRDGLYQALKANGTPGNWEHILKQIGMFSFTGLTPSQVEYLLSKYHIYLSKNGRINVCGLNPRNMEYVADAIKDAIVTYPETV